MGLTGGPVPTGAWRAARLVSEKVPVEPSGMGQETEPVTIRWSAGLAEADDGVVVMRRPVFEAERESIALPPRLPACLPKQGLRLSYRNRSPPGDIGQLHQSTVRSDARDSLAAGP